MTKDSHNTTRILVFRWCRPNLLSSRAGSSQATLALCSENRLRFEYLEIGFSILEFCCRLECCLASRGHTIRDLQVVQSLRFQQNLFLSE